MPLSAMCPQTIAKIVATKGRHVNERMPRIKLAMGHPGCLLRLEQRRLHDSRHRPGGIELAQRADLRRSL